MPAYQLLLHLALKYPWRILLNIVMGFSGALFNGVSAALIVPVLMSLLGQQAIIKSGPPIIQRLLSPFQQIDDRYQLLVMAGAIILIIVLKNLALYASNLTASALSRTLTADLQEQGLQLLLTVDLDFFTKAKPGDLMNRLGGEITRTTAAISTGISIVITVITIFVFLGLLLAISWPLTIAATLLLPLSALFSQCLVAKSRKFGRIITKINQDYSGRLIEIFSGIRLVKVTGTEQQEFHNLRKLIREREQVDFQSRMISTAIGPIGEVSNIIALFVLVLLGRALFTHQLESLSTVLLTYLVLLFRLLPYVSQINGLRENLARSIASIEIIHDLLRRDNKSFTLGGDRAYMPLRQGIAFENVSFAYPESKQSTLQNVSLFIPKGTTLALVGASGAGKSTLADLLPRFYDPSQGRITIDGADIRQFDLKSLRRSMGIVSQDTFLFNDSIRNNIAYGCPDVTETDIIAAIKRANAHEFIEQLPDGLETMIGNRGVMLSGGQRQRIAIARALLRDPDILILDEATSALDTLSEHLVQQALDELSRERTTIVIAHRLSTVQKAHQIAVLDRGQVVELGTHQELLRQNGHYSRLYDIQFAENTQRLSEAVNDRKQALAQASYEFRSQLNSMLGSLSLLTDGLADTPIEQHELASEAYDAALELFKLVRQLEKKAGPVAS